MKTRTWYSLMMGLPFFLISCGGGGSGQESEQSDGTDAQEMQQEEGKITLTPLIDSPKYPDATLAMNSPAADATVPAGNVNFDFSVAGYELGVQTADAAEKGMANSGKGQHIHLILNNGPYSAHYEPTFGKELEDGHYVALAFLSRSYHESVKNPAAGVVSQFVVGDGEHTMVDLEAPHMFYSRPKGEYVGADTKKVLLDFYLLNCDLSEGGYSVKATINGQEFTITDWVPHVMEGLTIGENTIKLELFDAEGNSVSSPFNPVERKVMLKEAMPQ